MRGMEVILEKQFRAIVEQELATRRLTRAELARLMKVSPQYVTNYLNGKKPGTAVIERFLRALGYKPRLDVERLDSEKSVPAA